jgi:hypothetical protein
MPQALPVQVNNFVAFNVHLQCFSALRTAVLYQQDASHDTSDTVRLSAAVEALIVLSTNTLNAHLWLSLCWHTLWSSLLAATAHQGPAVTHDNTSQQMAHRAGP